MMKTIKLALLDRELAWHAAVQQQIDQTTDLQLCISTHELARFSSLLAFTEINVVVLDNGFAWDNLLQIIMQTKRKHPQALVILREKEPWDSIQLRRVGVQKMLREEDGTFVLLDIIRSHFGSIEKPYQQLANKRSAIQELPPAYRKKSLLSPREAEVLRLLCAEKTNREIANQLKLSARTVEGYRKNMQEKVGARNLAGLVLYAVREGLVSY